MCGVFERNMTTENLKRQYVNMILPLKMVLYTNEV